MRLREILFVFPGKTPPHHELTMDGPLAYMYLVANIANILIENYLQVETKQFLWDKLYTLSICFTLPLNNIRASAIF